jgi:DNA-binding NtrC family response regulator
VELLTRVLIVDDSEADRRMIGRLFEKIDGAMRVEEASGAEAALERLRAERFDVAVIDLNMPGRGGIELIEAAGDLLEDAAVFVLTGERDFDSARRALRLRVVDYLLKEPLDTLKESFAPRVEAALERLRLVRENRRLQRELELRLRHLERVYEAMPDALFMLLDGEGRVRELSGPALHLIGGGECGDVVGRPLAEVLGGSIGSLAEAVEDCFRGGGAISNQLFEIGGDANGGRLLLVNLSRIDTSEPSGARDPDPWICCLRDVTPRHQELSDKDRRGFHGVIGRDPKIVEICNLIRRVAPLPSSVLIAGPTGSGKEVIARAIHAESKRASKPFVAVNCTALSREILESELFGHVRGAFTGAVAPRKGRFREANGGTLLLDEIGDTSESFQTKLLRVLESGEIEPVGQDSPIKVDVRILCATNRNLAERVRQGKFREDLFYRINVVSITLPPLAERPGDLPQLIEHFRRELNARFGKSIQFVSSEALRALAGHEWPGNVRELRHALERAFVVAEGPTIALADLPPAVRGADPREVRFTPAGADSHGARPPSSESMETPDDPSDEAARIREALASCGGSVSRTADMLGVHRTTLWRRMREFRIER